MVLYRLQVALQAFSSAFSLITGTHCRVTVKQLFCTDSNPTDLARSLKVRTLCRSEGLPMGCQRRLDF